MLLARQSSQSTFRLILTRYGDLRARNDRDALYVGLGDRFDDDRRLVRAGETPPKDVRDAGPACSGRFLERYHAHR